MTVTRTIARILVGLLFLAAGISGFLMINNPPPAPPGLAADFQHIFFQSRWVLFVDAMEALAGILLLANRYVPLALTILAGVLYNIFAFHLTMQPIGLPVPIVVLALWIVLAYQYRASFAPLLAPRASTT